MAIVTRTSTMLITLERSKLASLLLSVVLKNENPQSSIKAMYVVVCSGGEAEHKRMDVAAFEDKAKPEMADRWQPLRNALFLYPAQEIAPDIWNFAVSDLDYPADVPIIPCPILVPPDGVILNLARKLDRTKELGPVCKDNLIRLHKLVAPLSGQSLFEPEDQIVPRLNAAFA